MHGQENPDTVAVRYRPSATLDQVFSKEKVIFSSPEHKVHGIVSLTRPVS